MDWAPSATLGEAPAESVTLGAVVAPSTAASAVLAVTILAVGRGVQPPALSHSFRAKRLQRVLKVWSAVVGTWHGPGAGI